MTDAPTTTREQELQEEFKAGLDPDAVPQLATRIATIEAERDAEKARADRAERARDSVKAKLSKGEVPAKPRKLEPMDGDAIGAAIDDAVESGRKVEIAFSDGKKELTQIAPVVVEGAAWREHARGRMLSEPVTLSNSGDTSVAVHGYALLIEGKQVAYQTRSDALNVAPGQKVNLDNDIVF